MEKLRGKGMIISLALAAALILICVIIFMPKGSQPAPQESPAHTTQEPQAQAQATPAQDNRLDMFALLAESKLNLEPYRGKALFLNFFTEWCPYCMQEMPDIRKVHETYNQEDFEIILVHVWDGEDEKNSASIREQYGLQDLTFFEDEDKSLTRLLGLPGYPTSFFIDRDGYLVKGVPSAMRFEQMTDIIDSMGISRAEAPHD